MADAKLSALTAVSVPDLADLAYLIDVSDTTDDAAGSSRQVGLYRLLALLNHTCCGRLTTESGVPVSTSDRTAQSTIYFTPHNGNLVSVYDGTRWKMYAFTERSLALSGLTSGANYDVFIYDNAGTLTLELLVWTNDTTRATALVLQDGVWCKTGALTRRYLGTIRTTGTTTTEDSAAKRFVWNAYNRATRPVRRVDTTDTWTYASATWRQRRATAANMVEVVNGLDGAACASLSISSSGDTSAVRAAFGYDSTSSPTDLCNFVTGGTGVTSGMTATLNHQPAAGYHYYAMLEACEAAVSTTFYGDAGQTLFLTGLTGTYQC